MKRLMRWWSCLGGLTLLVAACRPPQDDPVVAYGAFSAAVKHHDTDAAFKELSTATQKAIQDRMKRVTDAACPPGALSEKKDDEAKKDANRPRCTVKADVPTMFFASGVKVEELGKMTLVQRDDGSAVIEVAEDGGSYRQKMVKEGGAWRVDLTEALR